MELAYISCPMTLGNRNHNWFQAAECQRQLMDAGYAVHNPAHALMFPSQNEFMWDVWLTMDEKIISRCDLIVLLPGESRGAERECRYAESIGLPILTLEQALDAALQKRIADARELRADGVTLQEIATKYRVTLREVSEWVKQEKLAA